MLFFLRLTSSISEVEGKEQRQRVAYILTFLVPYLTHIMQKGIFGRSSFYCY